MADGCNIKLDVSYFEKFEKALKNSDGMASQVGIFADHAPRLDGKSNVDIGYAHEYGSPSHGIPERSFLRVPLFTRLNETLEASRWTFADLLMRKVLSAKSFEAFFKRVGEIAVSVVLEAFDIMGPGWKEWKDPEYKNMTGMILSDSREMQRSISSRIKK